MKRTLWNQIYWCAVTCLLLTGAVGRGQITTATVTGLIADSSGSVVAGATVTVTDVNTGVVTKTLTNNQGLYRVSGLIPGTYRENIVKQGFKSVVKEGIELHVEDQVELNFSLEVGSVSESVTVEAGQPLIDTQSTSLGETIEGRQVEDAPLNGRNAMNLIALVPGVVPQGSSQGSANATQAGNFNPAGLGNYQIGGGIAGWNSTYIDGANVNASGQNWQALIPTQDSVGEFRVDTNAVSPQYGRYAGGIINFSTRSGGNQFHGTAYEYVRNTLFDANTFFNDRFLEPKAVLHQNQFGATLGGPIVHNKAFFFASWEQLRLDTQSSEEFRVPTPAEMGGDFRADGPTFDVKTFARADCNGVLDTFCPSELDPTAAAMYSLSPSFFGPMETNPAKLAALEASGYNADINPKQHNNMAQWVGRLDDQLTAKQRLFARFTRWSVDIPLASALATPATPTGPTTSSTMQAVLGDDYEISPTLAANVRLSYTRFFFDVATAGNGKYDLSQLGPNWAKVGQQESFTAPPTFFPDFSWFGQPFGLDLQQHNYNNNFSLSVNLTKVHGHHSIQFGGEARRIEYYSDASIYPSGNFITVGIGSPAGASGGVNSGIGNFVEGVTVYIPGLSVLDTVLQPAAYSYYQGYYATDTWQVTPKLTANIGVRWELPGAWLEKHDHDTVLLANHANPLGSFANPVPGGPTQLMGEIVGVNSSDYSSRAQTEQHLHLFEPRMGLNYSLDSKTVLRLGFGLSHPCLDCGSVSTEVSASPFNSATTLDGSPFGSLSDPYPNGINLPLGRSLNIMQPYSQFAQTLIGGSVGGQEPNQTFPYVMQWNVNMERSIGPTSAFMISYVGSRGVHLGANDINLNQLPDQYQQQAVGNPAFAAQLLTPVANPLQGIATPTGNVGGATANYGQFLLPYPEFSTLTSYGKFYGESTYHALVTTLKKRFSAGSTISVGYTWAHLISNIDSQNGYLESGQTNGSFGPQDYYNPKADRSDSAADVRQRLTAEYILDLPFGKGRRFLSTAHGILDEIIGGWGFNGITTLQTGLPVGVLTAAGDEMSSVFGSGTIRPNVVPGVSKKSTGSRYDRTLPGNTWFNTAAFEVPASSSFAFGNEGRLDSTLRNDGIDDWDMTLSKSLPIRERVSLQFKAEYFNVFNHPQFAFDAPDSDTNLQAGGATFGQISTTANQPRIGQLSLRLNF